MIAEIDSTTRSLSTTNPSGLYFAVIIVIVVIFVIVLGNSGPRPKS